MTQICFCFFLTCKLGSSKYMSNSVYKFRYRDANMSAAAKCVRKYYRSETGVKTQKQAQYFHSLGFCQDFKRISALVAFLASATGLALVWFL